MDLNDLSAFLLVAEQGGLSAAARAADESPATLGRRITRLEDHIGQPLFHRSAKGYRLTEAGHDLLRHSERFADGVAHIQDWQGSLGGAETVRITAGAWTTLRLLRAFDQLTLPGPDINVEFIRSEARLDIGHRQAEIGLRNARPVEPWLAGRKIGKVSFAIYDHKSHAAETKRPFIAVSDAQTPSARWLAANHKADPVAVPIALVVNDPRGLLDAALLGYGRALLPTFIGDTEPDLVQIEGPVSALTHDQWLVLHHETRHRPGVRAVATWVTAILT